MRARIVRLCGWLVLCLLLAGVWAGAARLQLHWPAISIRLQTPLPAGGCKDAAAIAAENGAQAGFWAEKTALLEGPHTSLQAAAVYFWGDAQLAWPAAYRAGGSPSSGDSEGCALTGAAAWQLFGSMDVVGQTITVDKKTYTIRGVLHGEQPAALFAGGQDTEYTAAEFVPAPGSDGGEQARDFVAAAGLACQSMVYGPSLAAGCRVLAFLPLAFALAVAAVRLLCALRRRQKAAFTAVAWGLALAFALALPALLGALPAWLVPARWSDFGFWQQLGETLSQQGRELLGMAPALKDIGGKTALLQCGVCGLCALWAASLLGMDTLRPAKRPAGVQPPP